MILVDTSIWADHFRAPHPVLVPLLANRAVVTHRLVIEELGMGHLPQRAKTLEMLGRLPALAMVPTSEFLSFVEREALAGSGIGPADAHLLAGSIEAGTPLWTRDKRLRAQAERLGCAWRAAPPL